MPPSVRTTSAVRAEICEPVSRVLGWMLTLRDAEGRIRCPDHKIEHTGKSAGAIVMACLLAEHAGGVDRDALFEAALQQGRRLVARLEREGESTCFTFRPGRHDPYNCSNNVIDGGACSDALAQLVTTFGGRLDVADREAFTHASVLHAQTYLRYCVLDKGIPAQRAWAMTGVAGAYALAGHAVLDLALSEGVRLLAEDQHPDGSYPYHPQRAGPEHPGASDVSAFYQSRVTAFLVYALQRAGRNPFEGESRAAVLRGLDFLCALHGPDGIKVGLLEAKPWYWGATYEVASHPFDVYALARAHAASGKLRSARIARRAFEAWRTHLTPAGRPRDHLPGHGRSASYQCPVFWAGHSSWMARALPDLEALWDESAAEPLAGGGLDISLQHFPSADLARLEDGRVVAWVRGKRPAFNVHHGSPHGAGLLRVVSKAEDGELLSRCRLGGINEGEWSGKHGHVSPGRGWGSGKSEQRFALWLARNAWRRGQRLSALALPARTFRRGVLAFAATRVSSAFDPDPVLSVLPDGVELSSRLAWRDGTAVPGTELVRTFRVTGSGLEVDERLVADGGVHGLRFQMPARAQVLDRDPRRVRYRLG